MVESISVFHVEKVKSFDLICIASIRWRLQTAPAYLKSLVMEKFVGPANENFTTFCKRRVYELWRRLFLDLMLKRAKILL